MLLPTSSSKYSPSSNDPLWLHSGDLNYEVRQTDRGDVCQLYHLNLLIQWNEVTPAELVTAVSAKNDLGPEAAIQIKPLALVPGFSPLPGRMDLIQHSNKMIPRVVACSRPYRLPGHKKKMVQEELKVMLELDVIEESYSDWPILIVLVPKTDGSFIFCVDYRKANTVEIQCLTNASV